MGRRAIGRLAPPPAARGEGIKTQRGKKKNGRKAALFGGEEGIRTLERLNTFTRFPGVRLQPLIHLSVDEARIIAGLARKKQGAARLAALTFPFGPERLKTGKSRRRAEAPAEANRRWAPGALAASAASDPHPIPSRCAMLTPAPPRSCSCSCSCSPLVLSFRLPARPLIGKASARPMICRPIIAK